MWSSIVIVQTAAVRIMLALGPTFLLFSVASCDSDCFQALFTVLMWRSDKIRLRLKDRDSTLPKCLAKKLWTARAPNLQRLSGASRASHLQNFGRIWRRDFEGARGGEKCLSPHISSVRGAGALIFLSSTGLCGARVQAKFQPPKLNGGWGARVQTLPPFFRRRQRGTRSLGNYGLDQSHSRTKLSGSSPHLSCKGLFFLIFACFREIAVESSSNFFRIFWQIFEKFSPKI